MEIRISMFSEEAGNLRGHGIKLDLVDSIMNRPPDTAARVIEMGTAVGITAFLYDLFALLKDGLEPPFSPGDDFDTSIQKTAYFFRDELREAAQAYLDQDVHSETPPPTPAPGDTDWEEMFRRIANQGGKGKECG